MPNEQTIKSDTAGNEANPISKEVINDGSTNMADKAIQAAERLEKANETTARNLDRQEKLMARQALGGTSGGGIETKPKTQEDIDREAAKKFMQEDE